MTRAVTDKLVALLVAGSYAEVESQAGTLIEQFPTSGIVWKILGTTLSIQGKDALDALQKAAEFLPDDAEVHNNLAIALHDDEQIERAIQSYRRSLELNPSFAGAHVNLGNALRDIGQLDDAIASYRRALQIKSDYAEAHSNLGNALRDIGQLDDAIASYRRALQIKSNYAEALSNLSNALRDVGQLDDALAGYRRALQIKPDYAEAHSNLGNALRDVGQLDDAIASYRRALQIKPDYVEAHSNLLMALQFAPEITREDVFAAHRHFGEQFETPLKPLWPIHLNNRDPDKRLKIGYVSGDFRGHAVAHFIEPVLANHDKSQVEVFCYSNSVKRDAVTDRLIAAADHWIPCLGMSDELLAKRIHDDGIDILVDLSGHTAHNRLLVFARKPAPLQITYLGYPGTSGLSAMDYRLTDRYTEPEGDQYYTEELLRLPDSIWCYRPAEDMQQATPLPALANGHLTFGSFNNANKIGGECIALWSTLLQNIPTAHLMMVAIPEGEARNGLSKQFREHGIANERIHYFGKLPSLEFRRQLQQVDITLDPFPVNGATTTCESLWMGVPVLTLVGQRFLSRAGLSVLSAAQLPDFTATTKEELIKTATLLANNLPLLANIRAGLREHLIMTPLFNQKLFTRNLENVYRDMWRRYPLS